MDILIIRDGGATKVSKTVAGLDEVESLRAAGFEVEVVGGEPGPVEAVEYSDGTTATGPGPLPEQSPAQQDAATTADQPEA